MNKFFNAEGGTGNAERQGRIARIEDRRWKMANNSILELAAKGFKENERSALRLLRFLRSFAAMLCRCGFNRAGGIRSFSCEHRAKHACGEFLLRISFVSQISGAVLMVRKCLALTSGGFVFASKRPLLTSKTSVLVNKMPPLTAKLRRSQTKPRRLPAGEFCLSSLAFRL